jgi:hypothetical protein
MISFAQSQMINAYDDVKDTIRRELSDNNDLGVECVRAAEKQVSIRLVNT